MSLKISVLISYMSWILTRLLTFVPFTDQWLWNGQRSCWWHVLHSSVKGRQDSCKMDCTRSMCYRLLLSSENLRKNVSIDVLVHTQALFYRKYSTDSDVWSYGMVLFEIWSAGKKPFSEITTKEVLKRINLGYCQPPPPGCPRSIYKLMVYCW